MHWRIHSFFGDKWGIICCSQLYREQLYLDVSKGLPDWGASNFPSFVMEKLVDVPSILFISPAQGDSDLLLAGVFVAVYTIIFVVLTTIRLVRSDVTKKTA